MGRKLAASVYVEDGDGTPVLYKANTTPPADVAKQITNPAAWQPEEDGEVDETPPPAKKTAAKRTPKKASGKKATDDSPDDAPPASSGAAELPADDADADTWRTFAGTVGVTVDEDADVDAVKAALTERGLLE